MSTNHTSDLPQGELSQAEGQAPAVDGLVARETGGEAVQVAQAGTTASDGMAPIQVTPGAEIDLSDISLDGATMTLDGQDLILTLADGTEVVLQDFITASLSDNPPTFQFSGDLQMSAADMLANASPAAGGELPPGVNPQAGTAGTQDDDGSTVTPETQGPIGPGADPLGPLGPTSLAFTAPSPELDVVFVPAAAVLPVEEEEEEEVCEEITCDQLFSAYMASWTGPVGTRISEPQLDDEDIVADSDYLLYQGTADDDLMKGNGEDIAQVIVGHGGDDTIVAGEDPFINVVHGDTPEIDIFNTKPTLLVGEGEADFGEPGNDIIFGSDNPEQLEVLIGGEGNDYLDGQSGYELIIGDELALSLSFYGEGDLPNDQIAFAAVPGDGTDIWFGNAKLWANNVFASGDNFNDVLFSGQGQAIMVGDVAASGISFGEGDLPQVRGLGIGSDFEIGYDGNIRLSASFSDSGTVTAYNDFIKAEDPVFGTKPDIPIEFTALVSEGGDLPQIGPFYNYMVGDVLAVGSTDGIYMSTYGEGGSGSAYTFNDYLCGADGADLMVGDLAQVGWHTFNQYIELSVRGSNSTSDQSFESHNDILLGYGGDDHMVGDVYTMGIHESDINLSVSNRSSAFADADNNTYDAFNDQFRPGLGQDLTVGDVHVDGFGNKIDLFAGNKVAGDGSQEDGGASADDNTFFAYNDEICDDGGAVAIGDVYAEGGSNDVSLVAANEATGSYGEGNSASNNTFTVFSDILHGHEEIEGADGGYGEDSYGEGSLLVGDVFIDNNDESDGDSDVSLRVDNTAYDWHGHSGEYGSEGGQANNNTFNAFNDSLVGTSWGDKLVGDVLADDMDGEIELKVDNEAQGADNNEGANGTANNNIFNAFNDTIDGIDGAYGGDAAAGDVAVFDGWLGGDDLKLKIGNLAEGGHGGFDGSYGEEGEDGGGIASGNTFNAFNDDITLGDAGNYKDTNYVAGDVYFDGETEGKIDLSVSNRAEGGEFRGYNGSGTADGNAFNAFNDAITVGDGHASVVGDLEFHGVSEGYIDLGVSNAASGGNYGVDDAASASNNTFNAFNDMAAMGYGEGHLVGDVYGEGTIEDLDLTVENFAGGSYGEGANASNNTFNAFNDTLTGLGSLYSEEFCGTGSELIGDVDIDRNREGRDSELNLSASNTASGLSYSYTSGEYGEGGTANENTFNAFNDTLEIGDGHHTLIGDVRLMDWEGDATLSASNEAEESAYGEAGQANGNTFTVFNDTMIAGDGYDLAVGDAYVEGELGRGDDLELSVSNFAGGSYGEGGEANNNDFDAFNDSIDIGDGGGTGVGDVFFRGKGHGDIKLQVSNAAAGLAAYSYSSIGYDGGEASNNTFDAFNDTIIGGMNSFYDVYEVETLTTLKRVDDCKEGGDTLVGDVYFDGDYNEAAPDIKLKVENEAGANLYSTGSYGEGGVADGNTFNAFNDTIVGGPDEGPEEPGSVGEGSFLALEENILVGDVMAEDAGDIKLKVGNFANRDADESYDPLSSASNNEFHAFNDTISMGYGEGIMVGDVHAQGGYGEGGLQIKMAASNEAGYRGVATDNVFNAFNDSLTGHDFDDTLVGDVNVWGGALDELKMKLENETEDYANRNSNRSDASRNTFNAFNDELLGMGGNNLLVGDVKFAGYDGGDTDIDLSALGTYGTVGEGEDEFSDTFTAWSDTLITGNREDTLVGDLKIGNNNGSINTMIMAGAMYGYSGAANGTYDLFNDTMDGGGDRDDMVGDIWTWGNGKLDIVVNDGFIGEGYEPGAFTMFNDDMTGGDGRDWMVGDLNFSNYVPLGEGINIEAHGNGAYSMFEDTMTGGEDLDYMVGDMVFDGFDGGYGSDETNILAEGRGTFDMFNDDMFGGAQADVMIGDIHFKDYSDFVVSDGTGSSYGEGLFQVQARADDREGEFSLFNDTMDGGGGDDHMVGDVLFDELLFDLSSGDSINGFNGKFEVDIEGYGEGNAATFELFSDDMTGGEGNDVMFGDFFFGSVKNLQDFDFDVEGGGFKFHDLLGNAEDVEFDFYIESGFGEGDVTIFSDILVGGDGDDHLIGQLGADELTGGAGADTFWFGEGDGSDPSSSEMFDPSDDVSDLENVITTGDVITDFNIDEDSIGLYGNLNKSDLDFADDSGNTIITVNTGEILATVLNVSADDMENLANFVTV